MKRVLFLDEVHPSLEKKLLDEGFTCVEGYDLTFDQVKSTIAQFQGIVLRGRILMNRELMSASKNLKFIARSGSGLENIDLAAANEMGIEVLSAPEGNRDAVGEHAIGMLLALFNKLASSFTEVRSGIWMREENRGVEIKGKTVGIIGFGNTGSALAKKLQGFDAEIIAYDKYKANYAPQYVREVGLNTLMREAEIVSIHLPLSKETTHVVNEEFISGFTKPFYLINTARGKHVSLKALLAGLDRKKILGACLDVLEFEKDNLTGLSFHKLPEDFKDLVSRENVLISPHVAGWTHESYERLSLILTTKILALYPK